VSNRGRVVVSVETERKKETVWATVEDNGAGLNTDNWESFKTTDTDSKIQIGGKGVGRLLWLDCLENIRVTSVYKDGSQFRERSFQFILANEDQIRNFKEKKSNNQESFFHVRFEGLKANGYLDKFPGRGDFVFQHLTSHFLPTFIGEDCPRVSVHITGETREYPKAIEEIVFRREDEEKVSTEEYGDLRLTLMECDKVASADLKGTHFVHFIAHDRTVHSQPIDGKLGLRYFGIGGNRVFHAILKGEFLDRNVNQQRTAFQFEDAVIERMINDPCFKYIERFLEEPLAKLKDEQREKIETITATYPSVAFGNADELQDKVPTGELKEDAIYGHLARERFRRDERQAEKIRSVLTRMKDGAANSEDFSRAIEEAGRAIGDAEQRSLSEYVVRRKVVLDFLELLLQKVRDDERDSAYQREDILHSFICPVRVSTVQGGGRKIEATSHDLWIVDERLTFAQYFSSDVEFSALAIAAASEERPDILIFDFVHGLRQTAEASSKVLIVEFKRPGRTSYDDSENPISQIERYVRRLQEGGLSDFKGRPINVDGNTIFYCFIVADIIGKIKDWTYTWQKTVDGRGRIYRPSEGFAGSIELIGWDALLADARARNQAFFDRVGISGKSFFSAE
jgi:hypothetical protein